MNSANPSAILELPTLEELKQLSVRSSYGKSLNKVSLSTEMMQLAINDTLLMSSSLLSLDFLFKYEWRVKSPESITGKYKRATERGVRFLSAFNDLIGIRIKVVEYPDNFPDFYRVVNLKNGKKIDDGYRAIHLYYQEDNFHYPVEIQLWSEIDYNFNNWTHTNAYKSISANVLYKVRQLYDQGLICSEEQFKERYNMPKFRTLTKEELPENCNRFVVVKDFFKIGSSVLCYNESMAKQFILAAGLLRPMSVSPIQVVVMGGSNALDIYSEYKPYTFVDPEDVLEVASAIAEKDVPGEINPYIENNPYLMENPQPVDFNPMLELAYASQKNEANNQ